MRSIPLPHLFVAPLVLAPLAAPQVGSSPAGSLPGLEPAPLPAPVQTDWSAGPVGPAKPVASWGRRSASASGVSWASVPGQLARSALPLASPVPTVIRGDANRPNSVTAGDLDGDGFDELVTTDPIWTFGFGAVYWWERVGEAWVQHTIDDDFYGAEYADLADVDGDGDLDVVAAAYYGNVQPPPPNGMAIDGRYAWFENLAGNASSWQRHDVAGLFWGASHVDAADLDGDGDLDLAGASELTDGIYEQQADIAWFENADGTGTSWIQHDVAPFFENASEVHAVDLDGDGDQDLVGAHLPSFGASQFHWWENLAGDGGTWLEHLVPFSFQGSGYLDVADVDRDGDPDLVGGGLNTGSVFLWRNLDGLGTSWQTSFVTTLPGGRHLELADADGDGDLDALIANRNGSIWGGAWWVEHLDGAGNAWQLRALDLALPSTRPWITPADADGDGKLDAVVVHDDAYGNGSDQISWWELAAFDTSGPGQLESLVLDGGTLPLWRRVSLDADLPRGTGLALEVRASDDPQALGPYAPVPASGRLPGLVDPTARYFQYRLRLGTSDPQSSPVVRELRVEWAGT